MLVAVGHHPRQGTLSMNPAGDVDQDVELPGSIAENPQLGRHPMSNQTAQQGPLTGDSHVPLSR